MKFEKSDLDKLTIGLLVAVAAVLVFNSYQLSQIGAAAGGTGAPQTNVGAAITGAATGIDVMPKGVPEIYGEELGVSYDDISAANQGKADATIRRLGLLDTQINLAGAELERYISVVSQISCEYCCGADSIIFPDGQAACGCAHSYAMRGLAKYLITRHGSEVSDEQILEELAKWKTLFFPGQMGLKAQALASNGIEFSYTNLGSNKYRGIEAGVVSGGQAGQVGGC